MATNKDFVVKNGLQVGANTSIEGSITTVDSVQFDTNAAITVGQGQLAWNADAGTLDLGIDNNVTLQLGQETHIHVKAGEALSNGDVVYASGAVGNSGQIEVSKYIANGSIEEKNVVGIATQDIASGQFGYVTAFGAVRGISTDGSELTTPETWNDGTILYVSPTVAGELTSVLPEAPNQAIPIAFVTSAHHSNGTLFVRAYELGNHLGELHDVHITSVANNQVLTYDGVNSRWINSNDLSIPGNLSVDGNLIISGNTTSVNTNNLEIEDLNITLASGATDASAADGAGITIDGANATITYNAGSADFVFNKPILIDTRDDERLALRASSGDTTDWNYISYYGRDGVRDAYVGTDNDGNLWLYSDKNTNSIRSGGNGFYTAEPFGFGAIPLGTGYKFEANGVGSNALGRIYTTGSISGLSYQTGTGHFRWSTQNTGHLLYNELEGHTAISVNSSGDVSIPTGSLTVSANVSATAVNATDFYGDLNGSVANTTLNYSTTTLDDSEGDQGKFYFDALNQKLKVHTGSVWVDAVPAGSGGDANTVSTDANTTFRKYTYLVTTSTNSVSGSDANSETLTYITTGEENVEVYVNGVKQVEGATFDYVATTGTAVTFTSNLESGDVVDVQVYELLTNDAYYLKSETYTQTETNSQITTALGGYVPKTGGTFTGEVNFNNDIEFNGGVDFNADYNLLEFYKSDKTSRLGYLLLRDDNPNYLEFNDTDSGQDFAFVSNNDRVMTLQADGKVGIGIDNPLQKLSVNGVINADFNQDYYGAWIRGDSSAGGYSSLSVGEWYSAGLYIQKKTGENLSHIYNYNAGHPIVIAAGSGNFGETAGGSKVVIGSTSAQTKLTVSTTGADGITLAQDAGATSNSARMFFASSSGNWAILNSASEFMFASGGTPGSDTGTSRVRITTTGTIYPDGANADLGSTTNPWQNIYTQDLVLSNESREQGNDIDGTKGNWTVQEGEDHLYLINNKNGKKYKFALEEIE